MTRLLGLGLLTLAATACQGEPDPNTEPEPTTDGTTTYTTFPDECGTGGGGSNDYCCQFNSNYCDSDTDTDTDGTTTNTTIPDECGTGDGGSDYCCQFNSNYCDSDTDTDTDPMPPDTDTDGRPAGCECIPDDDVESGISFPTCGEQLCGHVSGSCGSWCDESPAELLEPEVLECALMALRDRTPGLLTWTVSWEGGYYDESGYVLINADGTAVRRSGLLSDNFYEAGAAELGALPPAEHFDACLAGDDSARLACLRAELDSMLGICDAGWTEEGDPGV